MQNARKPTTKEKRMMIISAAKEVFADAGLEGASLRSVAAHAGYTPAALYFHFESKEALYAEVLMRSLEELGAHVDTKCAEAKGHKEQLMAAAMGFFTFYLENPRDLDLGFYLFRGGMKPAGLGRDRDGDLNASLNRALRPIAEEAKSLGATEHDANLLLVDCFAHATGLLLLLHTGRIRMFGASAVERMEAFLREKITQLTETP
ncbi:TetR/AcrR family transcriptional regulator [Roseobacter litoralis]|jgi:AcrR family transcriptional regulator|uniref:TetR/AcrR family transcriptional regulator n=1 Tax=Roseobacter litoralis TaxID=42443 RepID=UPI002494BF3D|nr:TetR/AcrR family transcriptional regulator [Roseobacter litoralis]